MKVSLYINSSQYITYGETDNVLANDSRLITNGDTHILSGKYYGSSTCLGEKGWIGYWNDETDCLVDCKTVELTIKIERTDTIIHSTIVSIPSDFTPSRLSFEVNDEVIKRVFIRDLHRFARPIPLEISGIEFEL
jgi:hypothetical protein